MKDGAKGSIWVGVMSREGNHLTEAKAQFAIQFVERFIPECTLTVPLTQSSELSQVAKALQLLVQVGKSQLLAHRVPPPIRGNRESKQGRFG